MLPTVQPGDITRMLNPEGSSLPTQAMPQMAFPSDSAATQMMPAPSAAEPGELTNLLNPPGSSPGFRSVPDVSPPQSTAPGEFTRMFEQAGNSVAPPPQTKQPVAPPPKPAPAPYQAPQSKPPTPRHHLSQPMPLVTAKPKAASESSASKLVPHAPPKTSNYMPLIYVMAGAIVALLALVFFLMRH
jgi:hypothetical protein